MGNAQEIAEDGLPPLILAIDELVAAAASNDELRIASANAAVMAFLESTPIKAEPSSTGFIS